MLDKIFDLLKQPGYIKTQTIRVEITKEEILQLIREGKLRVRADGYVEAVDVIEDNNKITNITQDQYTVKNE